MASYPPSAPADPRLARLRELCGRFEIRPDFASKLRQLESFEIVLLVDDSGSMATTTSAAPGSDPYGPGRRGGLKSGITATLLSILPQR